MIEAAGHRALEWVVKHLDCFDPRYSYAQDSGLELKAYTELLYLTNYILRTPHWRGDTRVQSIVQFVRESWSPAEFLALAQNSRGCISLLACLAEFYKFAQCPTEDTDNIFRTFLQRMVDVDFTAFVYRTAAPFRVLDLLYTLNSAGIETRLQNVPLPIVYRRTIAAKARNLAYLSKDDLYSITHTIFYLTDMGYRSADKVIPGSEDRLRKLTRNLLGVMVRDRDFDLIAEFLMCFRFLNMPPHSPISVAAWQALLQSQLEDGAVPSFTFNPIEEAKYVGNQRVAYRFLHCYHTTLVFIGAVIAERGFTAFSSAKDSIGASNV